MARRWLIESPFWLGENMKIARPPMYLFSKGAPLHVVADRLTAFKTRYKHRRPTVRLALQPQRHQPTPRRIAA
jgi:hypothetical protein